MRFEVENIKGHEVEAKRLLQDLLLHDSIADYLSALHEQGEHMYIPENVTVMIEDLEILGRGQGGAADMYDVIRDRSWTGRYAACMEKLEEVSEQYRGRDSMWTERWMARMLYGSIDDKDYLILYL